MWGISKKFNIRVQKIAKINKLNGSSIHKIQVGQKIYIDEINKIEAELILKIILLDLSFKPISKGIVKLEYDGKSKEINFKDGVINDIEILDHSKGLKVYYKNIKSNFDLIANHKTLPIGKKVLRLTSRQMKVSGSHYPQSGIVQQTIEEIKKSLKNLADPIEKGVNEKIDTSQPSIILPKPVNSQKRTDLGNSTHIIASQFTEESFILNTVNNKYRKFVIDASKRHGFTPHSLAALIHAEAAKKSNGEWDSKSFNTTTNAAGLTQFLKGTWLELCKNQESLIGQYASKNKYLTEEQLLNLRFNSEFSIDAAAAYAIINFKWSKLPYQKLTEPSSIAKFAYLLHHEGAGGARSFINNSFSPERAKMLLLAQFGNKGKQNALDYLKRYDNDAKVAYGIWLRAYIDAHINIYDYVLDKSKTSGINLSLDETIKILLGQISSPTPTPTPSTEIQENKIVGGSGIWVDPLAINQLRVAGLANVKSATFGKVRNGGTRNHQGIDLAADSGTNIFAVCSGVIAIATDSGKAYGKIIVLEVNIDDLPEKQKTYASKNITNSQSIYFFYAHLSTIDVEKGDVVDAKTILGKTGSTGNAKGMTTISKGGHLHFEARSSALLGTGLQGRFDPIPFFITKLI